LGIGTAAVQNTSSGVHKQGIDLECSAEKANPNSASAEPLNLLVFAEVYVCPITYTALTPAMSNINWTDFLQQTLQSFGCVSGTLHRLDPADGLLKLVVHSGIPESIMPMIQVIPVGKGIAGAAAESRAPVELCNLQTDTSGVAKPEAKKTQVQGSIAVPVLRGTELRGTLGIGKREPYEFTAAERSALLVLAESIAAEL
jgi:transcriptional regulator with GAF, ATPase, and Fis domain